MNDRKPRRYFHRNRDTTLRIPKLVYLRTDPFERADVTSNAYYEWFLYHDYVVLAAQAIVTQLPPDPLMGPRA